MIINVLVFLIIIRMRSASYCEKEEAEKLGTNQDLSGTLAGFWGFWTGKKVLAPLFLSEKSLGPLFSQK